MPETLRTTSSTIPKAVDIVRAAVAARTPEEAAAVNDMIALHLGVRHERFVADRSNNLGLLTTPGEPDQKALEPITNMHDTLLERFARERYGDPSLVEAKTPHEAVAELLGHLTRKEQADLARVDVFESDPPARRTKRVTIVYREFGCGIANSYIPESIFHAGSTHKNDFPWLSGAFGMGGTTCYPHVDQVVLVTRRRPELLDEGEEDVISVAVAEWQQHSKGRGIYYLVDATTDLPLAVPAEDVPEFDAGTHLAFVSYQTSGFHTGRNDRSSLEFLLNTRLWDPPLPVRLMNHVATGDHAKDHQGRRRLFQTLREDRRDLRTEMPFRLAGRTYRVPIDVHYFEAGPSADKGGMRNFVAHDHAVMLVANGQAHKHWTPRELKHRADRLPKLYDRLLVVAYLDQIPVEDRTGRLFTPDRVDLVKNDDANRLQDQIGALLNSYEPLREINNELVRKALENRSEGRSTMKIAERIKSQLAFKGGFKLIGEKEGEGERPRKAWARAELWPDPTTLEGPERVTVKPGTTKFLHFHINAVDEFFTSGRGRLDVVCDHPRIGEAELIASTDLHRGIVRVSLLVPEDVEPGEARILACVGDWMKANGSPGEDLQWETKVKIVDPAETAEREPQERPKRKTGGPTTGPLVALVWQSNDAHEDWDGGTPGHVQNVEAEVLADEVPEYKELASQGSTLVPTIYLNEDYTPLKKYEQWRARSVGTRGLDDARDRYAVAAGVGLLVLHERELKRTRAGKSDPDAEDVRTERQAVARAALAMMPDIDKLIREAELEPAE